MARILVRLTREDRWLLVRRYGFHGNSFAALAKALVREGEGEETIRRLRALHRVERRFGIDLGFLCHEHRRCRERRPHPLERLVMAYVTVPSANDGDLILDVDRIREVIGLIRKGLERESA
ncbi:MAG: hypothetical protein HY702_04270 [Gemmatimonadetes bacterium]|nr:hypothetical protein [Gemmatimonadota bacterium]